jgi:hypothetical protein
MSIRFAPWILVALGSGCSLILDTGDLPQRPDGRPGEIDAGPPDAPPVDANRMDFSVDSADPTELFEGAGAKGVPVVVRFYGMNIIDPTVAAAWSDGFADAVTVVESHASNTFDEIAVALRVPVRPDLDEGACGGVSIRFDFMQAGATMADAVDVPLHCLDELTDINALDSAKTYSRIVVTAARSFAPTDPAPVLRAVEDIQISAALDVDAEGRIAGPGSGCDGGTAGASSSCTGGGAAGMGGGTITEGGGGGGGGYHTDGGGGAGVAGIMHGRDMLVPLAMAGTEGNHGSGGGGGGDGTLGNPGVGGGGGGTIQLIAGGEIVVSAGALVRARGADGTAGTGGLGASGGGGGGGSGGAILVRAGAGVRFIGGTFPWLTAPKGAGGTSPGNDGGAGSDGRVRIDQPVTTPSFSAMVTGAGAAGGPAWDPAAPVLVTFPEVVLVLRGQPGMYGIILGDDPIANEMGGNVTITLGSRDVTVSGLDRGPNRICALYAPIGFPDAERPEAQTCVDVFYVPTDH